MIVTVAEKASKLRTSAHICFALLWCLERLWLACLSFCLAHALKSMRCLHGGILSIVAILVVGCRNTGGHSECLQSSLGLQPSLACVFTWIHSYMAEYWTEICEPMWTEGCCVSISTCHWVNCPTTETGSSACCSFILLRLICVRRYVKSASGDYSF